MERFVAYENIRRFRQLLGTPLEPAERRLIEGLLVTEQAKLASGGSAAAHLAKQPQPDLRTSEDPA